MREFDEEFENAVRFHGHKCPAMPIGFRAGKIAMRMLGVQRSKNKELTILSETGKGHAAGCFLDGIMSATGCTYGKANIQKLYYNKLAFTLTDAKTNRSIRVSVNPDFLEKALNSPFVQKRKNGIEPQDIPAEIVDPLVNKVLTVQEKEVFSIGKIKKVAVEKKKGIFDAKRCDNCGEITFVNKLRLSSDGRLLCIPCSAYGE